MCAWRLRVAHSGYQVPSRRVTGVPASILVFYAKKRKSLIPYMIQWIIQFAQWAMISWKGVHNLVENKLDFNSVIPLYHQLKVTLIENIENGTWKPGKLIPSEHQFISEYGVSRNTVKKAIGDLVQLGYLTRMQGKGTFVSTPKLEQSLSVFYSFSQVMRKKGIPAEDLILDLDIRKPPASIARKLEVDPNEPVHELRRLRCANDEPIILEVSYIPTRLVQQLTVQELNEGSLYGVLERKYDIHVTSAKESFEPVLIRDYEGELLKIKTGYPALLLDRVAYTSDNKPVEFCRSIVRGDKCRFYTELI